MCRGLLGAAALGPASARGDAAATLAALSQSWAGSSSSSVGSGEEEMYCPDRAAMERAGLAGWACVPAGVETALAQPLRSMGSAGGPSEGTLLLLSERPRALSGRERAWAAALAAKLADVLRA